MSCVLIKSIRNFVDKYSFIVTELIIASSPFDIYLFKVNNENTSAIIRIKNKDIK